MRVIHSSYFPTNLNNQPNMCENKFCQVAQRHVSSANSCSSAWVSREAICGTENQSNQTYLGSVDSRENSDKTMVFNPIGYQVS